LTSESLRPRLQTCLAAARVLAQHDGSSEIQTHHLLQGLRHAGVGAAAMDRLGLTAARLQDSARRLFDTPAPVSTPGDVELSAEATHTIEAARRYAQEEGSAATGTEHLLAALTDDPGSHARRVLNDLAIDAADIKRALQHVLCPPPQRRWPSRGTRCSSVGVSRVVDRDDEGRSAEDSPVEIVAFGPKRPLLRSRWLLVAAALVAVVVAVVVVRLDRRPFSQVTPPATSPTAPTTQPTTEPTSPPVAVDSPRVTEVGRWLLGVTGDWELFARGPDEVVRIQPALGRITQTRLPALQSSGPVSLIAGTGGVVVRPLDYVPGYIVPDGAPARPLPAGLGQSGEIFPGPDRGHVWVQGAQDGRTLVLVGLDGTRTGPSIRLPATTQWPLMSDGAGYVLVRGVGGDYDARPDGLRRVTRGSVAAVGPTGWLALECDDRARCVWVAIDRATGSRRTLAGPPADPNVPAGAISPDGSVAAVFRQVRGSEPQTVHLVDLASGADYELAVSRDPDVYDTSRLAWSPDSRWLFLVTGKRLVAVDPRTRAVHELGVDLPPIEQVTVRR